VDSLTYAFFGLGLVAVILSVIMLFARTPITGALSLLGIMLTIAGMYGLMQEHFIAAIQLVVYAGAVMVLFIFSIMLLNLKKEVLDFKLMSPSFLGTLVACVGLFVLLVSQLGLHFESYNYLVPQGQFTPQAVVDLGGNTKVLAHALFSQYYLSFEVISLALLVAIISAVVLAKRKFD